ncbi:5-formyltetrahydrofolate cyclo-ligase [Arsenicitalea aurantiaca]|uniref:5-formyltetrahydrofolate cyclo-ligase n=1 Tax=Arsenicitalea aurantiaca TaxID=1783274 RepID=UPI00195E5DFA|nr:5-formyltetrahydrofolate cyclo-ligase [Arsenicitalea aurantiaca]
MTDIAFEAEKALLRDRARAQRARISTGDRAAAARAAASHFGEGVEVPPDAVVALYWPIRDEIDCRPLLARLMDGGQAVCLPVVEGDDAPLLLRLWEAGTPLYPSGFGTLAPVETAPVAVPDIMVIPLLGFDRMGTRLGYGRGYYDRTIANLPRRPLLVGYAFAAQEVPAIPRAPHDVPLDLIVTEHGVRRFARPADAEPEPSS